MTGGRSSHRGPRPRVDDAGGVWIITGFVLGAIVGGVLINAHPGRERKLEQAVDSPAPEPA